MIHLAKNTVESRLEKLERYTSREVERRGPRRYNAFAYLFKPFARFLHAYLFKGGFCSTPNTSSPPSPDKTPWHVNPGDKPAAKPQGLSPSATPTKSTYTPFPPAITSCHSPLRIIFH